MTPGATAPTDHLATGQEQQIMPKYEVVSGTVGSRDPVTGEVLTVGRGGVVELTGRQALEMDGRVKPANRAAAIALAEAQTPAPALEDGTETVVVFTFRPALDEARWQAVHDAARAAGAVHVHVNPPSALAPDGPPPDPPTPPQTPDGDKPTEDPATTTQSMPDPDVTPTAPASNKTKAPPAGTPRRPTS